MSETINGPFIAGYGHLRRRRRRCHSHYEPAGENHVDDKLQQAANRYADLFKETKRAQKERDEAATRLNDLNASRKAVAQELGGFVGNNIRKKAVTLPDGIVVTIEHVPNGLPTICLYEAGEEIS